MWDELARSWFRRTFHPQREPIPGSVRRLVCDRDGNRCRDCHLPGTWRTLQMGHNVAWSAGGTDDASNLYPTCWECNRRRGAYVPLRHRLLRGAQWTVALASIGTLVGLTAAALMYGPAPMRAAAGHLVTATGGK